MATAAPMKIGSGVCCFCGKSVEPNGVDPCSVVVETTVKGQWQFWYCHAACFRERLADGMEPQFI
jgi:hypothetical protein